MTGLEVRDHPARSRYELLDDGRVLGFTEYRPRDGVLVFPHTVVAQQERGSGYATVLLRGALDDVRRKGVKIVPQCSFVADFIEQHPEYADLVAASG
jgi:predicted GNAT family acetyltransferase